MKKALIKYSLIVLITGSLFCGDENTPPNNPGYIDTTGTDAEAYGTFLVQLKGEDLLTSTPAYTSVTGAVYNGPEPPEFVFEETMREGDCRLLKRVYPKCDPSCGSNAKCVQNDSCMPYSNRKNVGEVTVSGMKSNGSKITFILKPINLSLGWTYQKTGVTLDYPPFTEGDTVTFAAAGSSESPAFTLKTRAIAPLKVLTQTAMLEDGKPINLKWEKPGVQGVSRIAVRVNISYHGGTAGEIHCDCEDDGEITIAAKLLDELKTYGMAGYPVADVSRKSIGKDADAKAQLVLESTVTVGLTYPDKTSCTGDGDCPEGYHCTDRRLCEPDK